MRRVLVGPEAESHPRKVLIIIVVGNSKLFAAAAGRGGGLHDVIAICLTVCILWMF